MLREHHVVGCGQIPVFALSRPFHCRLNASGHRFISNTISSKLFRKTLMFNIVETVSFVIKRMHTAYLHNYPTFKIINNHTVSTKKSL